MPKLPRFEAIAPPDLRPSLWGRAHALLSVPAECSADATERFPEWLEDVRRSGVEELSAAPALAELGHDLVARENELEHRRLGCVWLTMFPSLETVAAMRAIAVDDEEPLVLRDQAAWTLGFRQLQTRHPSLFWSPEVVRAADEALVDAWHAMPRDASRELHVACRHVAAPALLDAIADDPVRDAAALEAFATEKLARAVLARLAEIPAEHAPRAIRLVAATLGAEAAEPLLAHAARALLPDKVEALLAALALDPARARPAVDAFLATLAFPADVHARAAWHEAHPGAHPIVSALKVARTTGAVPPAERAPRCREACAGLAALGALGTFPESYLYALWRHMALASADGDAVVACVEAHPKTLDDAPFLVRPYLEALAARGRFDRLAKVAIDHARAPLATWLLATHGRPFRALAMRRASPLPHLEAVAGGALALFLVGRPDLAERALAVERPLSTSPGATFPGPDEAWRLAHGEAGALRAWTLGVPGLLAEVKGAPEGGEGDAFDLELLSSFEKALRTDLAGATVCIVGRFADAARVEAELVGRGAQLVSGPFARTDFFVAAPDADPQRIARLTAMGVKRLAYPFVTTA